MRECKRLFDGIFRTRLDRRTEDRADDTSGHASRSRSFVPVPTHLRSLIPQSQRARFTEHARHVTEGVTYTRASTHCGNSLIYYRLRNGAADFGTIQHIFEVNDNVRFAVRAHLPTFTQCDPFRHYNDFPATVRSAVLSPELQLVEPGSVLCHYARWKMPSGDVAVLPLFKVCHSRPHVDDLLIMRCFVGLNLPRVLLQMIRWLCSMIVPQCQMGGR